MALVIKCWTLFPISGLLIRRYHRTVTFSHLSTLACYNAGPICSVTMLPDDDINAVGHCPPPQFVHRC